MQLQLQDIRTQLDTLDQKIVLALAQRLALVREVGARKRRAGADIRDPDRERQLIDKLTEAAQRAGVDPQLVQRLYGAILEHSVRMQQNLNTQQQTVRVAYQGVMGSYSSQAARQHFAAWTCADGRRLNLHGLRDFSAVFDALVRRDVEFGVLPIENTIIGSIHRVYDLLARTSLAIVGEEVVRVDHCLVAAKPMPLGSVRRIRSQPPALDQCKNLLGRLRDVVIEPYEDTAAAARSLVECGEQGVAAIASTEAARRYGLHIIAHTISDQPANFTRFVVVAPAGAQATETAHQRYKTSLLLTTRHEPGALAESLRVLASHGLDLVRIESRPRPGCPWQYWFYIDFIGNARKPDVQQAMRKLGEHAVSLRILGSYPAHMWQEASPNNMYEETYKPPDHG